MQEFKVIGMNCSACASSVERAVNGVEGVSSCTVSLLTNSMLVEGNFDVQTLIKAVNNAGYQIEVGVENKTQLLDVKTKKIKNRLILSIIILLFLMYFSMGRSMFSLWLPDFLVQNPFFIGLIQLALSLIILITNRIFFIKGFKSLIKRSPNMDSLVAIGSLSGFIYSLITLVLCLISQIQGDNVLANSYLHDMYFDSSAMILVLITVGKLLESYSKGKTTNALKNLIKLKPKTTRLLVDGKEQIVSIEAVKEGDVFIIKSGDSIPVDGVVLEGELSINESFLTGESVPSEKSVNSNVFAGTICLVGYAICRANKVGEGTTLSQIIKTVKEASLTKAPIQKIADKVSGVFVPIVLILAFITFVLWLVINGGIGYSLTRAISVLVISCPCALGLATPVAIMVGSGVGAKMGILFKNAKILENAGKVKVVALDKTGTITNGKPIVENVFTFEKYSITEVLSVAGSVEAKSEHPLAKAIVNKCIDENIPLEEVSDFNVSVGYGVNGKISNKQVSVGNYDFVSSSFEICLEAKNTLNNLSKEGKTPILVGYKNKVIGVISISDKIKNDSLSAIKKLQSDGIMVVMLTGDNEITANEIGKSLGVNKVIAELKPTDKKEEIEKLKKYGGVLMVGDGINDAPALVSADIGVAVGDGTDVAIDSADIVLTNSKISDVITAIKLSKKTLSNIKQNLFWAFIYNGIGIPLAAGVFIPLGITLSPMIGALAMSLSSFCVVMNALRLNFFKAQPKVKNKKSPKKIVIKVDGLHCAMCEKKVVNAIQTAFNTKKVKASFQRGEVVVKAKNLINIETLKNVIEAQGFKTI